MASTYRINSTVIDQATAIGWRDDLIDELDRLNEFCNFIMEPFQTDTTSITVVQRESGWSLDILGTDESRDVVCIVAMALKP